MKELAQSFLGRVAALDPLLAGGDANALADVLRRNVYTEVAAPAAAAIDRLAGYLQAQDRWLDGAGRRGAAAGPRDVRIGRGAWLMQWPRFHTGSGLCRVDRPRARA